MIRPIEQKDREIYFEMSRKFYSSGAAIEPIPDSKREAFWNTLIDGVYARGYIIECENKTAGYAITVPYASQECGGIVLWVDELFVLPEFRGRGLAKAFFKYAESLSGSIALRLEAEPDNKKAIGLYESLGFKVLPYLQMIKK